MPLFLLLAVLLLVGGVKVAKGTSPKVIRSLDELAPDFRAKFEAFLAEARALGYPLIVAETYRSPARQAWLYGSSRASYIFEGVEYGRPGEPWLTDRTPVRGSNHQRRRAADTIPDPKNPRMPGVKADSKEAVAYLRALEPVAAKHGLKNLPSIKDYGHWEDA